MVLFVDNSSKCMVVGVFFVGYHGIPRNPQGHWPPCTNLRHISKKEIFCCNMEGNNWIGAAFDVGINLLSTSLVMLNSHVAVNPWTIFCSLGWKCRQLFILFNHHSPHSSLDGVVPWMKLWMEPPTLCFPIFAQLSMLAHRSKQNAG